MTWEFTALRPSIPRFSSGCKVGDLWGLVASHGHAPHVAAEDKWRDALWAELLQYEGELFYAPAPPKASGAASTPPSARALFEAGRSAAPPQPEDEDAAGNALAANGVEGGEAAEGVPEAEGAAAEPAAATPKGRKTKGHHKKGPKEPKGEYLPPLESLKPFHPGDPAVLSWRQAQHEEVLLVASGEHHTHIVAESPPLL